MIQLSQAAVDPISGHELQGRPTSIVNFPSIEDILPITQKGFTVTIRPAFEILPDPQDFGIEDFCE